MGHILINGISMGRSLMEYIDINDGLYNGNIMGIQWNMFMRYDWSYPSVIGAVFCILCCSRRQNIRFIVISHDL